jgi:hypothetical protein
MVVLGLFFKALTKIRGANHEIRLGNGFALVSIW